MKKVKGILYIIFSMGFLIISGVLFYGLILSEFYVETDFEKTGTAINKSIVWLILFGFMAINGLIYGIKLIMPVKDYKKQTNTATNRIIEIKSIPRFDILLRTTYTDTLVESLIYLLVGVIVLPQIQDKSFIEPFNLLNIVLLLFIVVGTPLLLRITFIAFRYFISFRNIKEIKHLISEVGIEIRAGNKVLKFDWDTIKSFQETPKLFKIKQSKGNLIHIFKEFIEQTDLDNLRKILSDKIR